MKKTNEITTQEPSSQLYKSQVTLEKNINQEENMLQSIKVFKLLRWDLKLNQS